MSRLARPLALIATTALVLWTGVMVVGAMAVPLTELRLRNLTDVTIAATPMHGVVADEPRLAHGFERWPVPHIAWSRAGLEVSPGSTLVFAYDARPGAVDAVHLRTADGVDGLIAVPSTPATGRVQAPQVVQVTSLGDLRPATARSRSLAEEAVGAWLPPRPYLIQLALAVIAAAGWLATHRATRRRDA